MYTEAKLFYVILLHIPLVANMSTDSVYHSWKCEYKNLSKGQQTG